MNRWILFEKFHPFEHVPDYFYSVESLILCIEKDRTYEGLGHGIIGF